MLFKNYRPVRIPETLAIRQFHFLLPDLLRLQNSFEAAVNLLDEPTIRCMPFRVAKDADDVSREIAEVKPQVRIMISRPPHEKARSIKHCCQLAGLRRMSVERKYDGEYCQIHIDVKEAGHRIKIFSKSGKDSTIDRIGLHHAVRDCLLLDTVDCKIKRHCILEGELLVWTDADERIEPFHKIRKHVKRSGRFIGTARDSPVDLNEYLMIMFYDIMLLDDTVSLTDSHDRRRHLLEPLTRLHHLHLQLFRFLPSPLIAVRRRQISHTTQRGGMLLSQHPQTRLHHLHLQLFGLLPSPLIPVRRRQQAHTSKRCTEPLFPESYSYLELAQTRRCYGESPRVPICKTGTRG
jgi:hypothetical protein